MKIRSREMPAVDFRRELPAFLSDDPVCFIEVKARAGGLANPVFMAARQDVIAVTMARNERVANTDDMALFDKAAVATKRAEADGRVAAIYDACVIEWTTNAVDTDTGAVMVTSGEAGRKNFIAFANAPVNELAKMVIDLEVELILAGMRAVQQTEADVKN